jgi:phage terminase large subunit GpA-like protein
LTFADEYDGRPEILRTWRQGFKPDPLLRVSTWADRYRVLTSRAASEPGRYRTERTPYMREIMDRLSPSDPAEKIVLIKGAQIGATEAANNAVGYWMHQTPGPILLVQPTVELAKRNSQQRIDPLIEDCTELRAIVKPARSRDSGNTVLSKEFTGGLLVLTGANSAVGLRSMPARFLVLDEVDAYEADIDGEGDPVSLAEARTRTFGHRRKIFMLSTPTIEGFSRIAAEFEGSDKRYYFIPCPHCQHMQWLRFERLRWEKGKPETAAYFCESCEKPFYDHHKARSLGLGEWRPTALSSHARLYGYHISALYAPTGWISWPDIAREWEAAQESDARIKAAKNTLLGETWTERGEAPDWQRLYDRREDYRIGTVPEGGLILTAGVDVQKDRLEVEIVAWGRDRESWSIDYRVLQGDPYKKDVWEDLDEVLAESFRTKRGGYLQIARMGIDTGYATQAVYDWTRKHPGRAIAVKGFDRLPLAIGAVRKADVSVNGKRLKRGMVLWQVGTGFLKSELYGLLRKEKPTDENLATGEAFPSGYCHFPKYGEEFFKQLAAERLVTVKDKRGYPRSEWRKLRERNEALDCRIYARATAAAVGIDRFSDMAWQKMENAIAPVSEPQQAQSDKQKPASSERRIIKSNYV